MAQQMNAKGRDVPLDKLEEERVGRELVRKLLEIRIRFPQGTGLSLYDPRESDVVITTFAKAGTTLMQQMGYQLAVLSGGAGDKDKTGEDFTDDAVVSPWIDYYPQFGLSLYETFPRILKTHSRPQKFLQVGHNIQKHVVIIRDPKDYPASWLDFLYDSTISNGEPQFAELAHLRSLRGVREAAFHEFIRLEMLREASDDEELNARPRLDWFDFASEWLKVYDDDRINNDRRRIMVFFYEDIVKDLPGTVKQMAEFINVKITSDEMINTVVSRCDRAYMAGNDKFKCQAEARAFNVGTRARKARHADEIGFKEFQMTEHEKNRLQTRFQEVFDVDNYDEFKMRFKEQNQQN